MNQNIISNSILDLFNSKEIFQIQKRLNGFLKFFQDNINKISKCSNEEIISMTRDNTTLITNIKSLCLEYKSDMFYNIFQTFCFNKEYKRDFCKKELFDKYGYWIYSFFINYHNLIDYYTSLKHLEFYVNQFNYLINIVLKYYLMNPLYTKMDTNVINCFRQLEKSMIKNSLFFDKFQELKIFELID